MHTLKTQKDLGPGLLCAAGLLLLVAKLVLAGAQNVFLWPEEALLDDMVMYDAAVSIANGQWLGPYTYATLAKSSFFALWVAGLHTVGMPYLLGGQLLWAAASALCAWAFAPVHNKRWAALVLFGLLLFCPSSVANPHTVGGSFPVGYITRVYRDNIFPALCLLVVAGMAGFALRLAAPPRHSAGWLVLAGAAFAACWLCREDGWWLLPFVVAAAVACLWHIARAVGVSRRQKWRRGLCLLLPFVLLAAGLLAWCGANQAAYGRFVLNDFSSGEFADAYGALTRPKHQNWQPKVAVPREVRQQLYALVPRFAQLEDTLESPWYLERYAGKNADGSLGDYTSGAFYWALREAAAEAGHYASPQAAQAYFTALAQEVNAVCDAGLIAAGPRRSSVNPPIRAAYIVPVLGEGLYSLWFCATFQQCDARSLFSPHANDPAFYAETIAPMEDFLHQKALTATRENSEEPYYSPWQRLCFGVFAVLRWVYALALPLGLVTALGWQLWQGGRLAGQLRRRQRLGRQGLVWLLGLGLWACILLRSFMIAFVTVSSFGIGTFVMYLAAIHPLMLVVGWLGAGALVPRLAAGWRARKKGRANPPTSGVA